jgi:glycosyltransferase involved in cell wall biosynthesis
MYSGDCLIALLRAKGKKNIAYMHTPPRHLYDCYEDRLREYPLWKKILFVPFAIVNRWRFEWLSKKFDVIATNSKNVQARIKQYLHRDSVVVYPPCNTLLFKNLGQGNYFFSWARLYPIKRVDKIVEAFTRMPDKKLIVASGGPDEERIRKLAEGHSNITILGWISDEDLLKYVGNCLATIYIPVREDFGMSPVESMTAGKPVIGVAEGGMLEVIEDGKNGVLLKSDFTIDDIILAVKNTTSDVAKKMEEECLRTAEKFTEEKFVEGIEKVIY